MSGVARGAALLTKHIGVFILLAVGWACWQPEVFGWAVGYTPVFLGAAMFGMGLAVRAEDCRAVFTRPRVLLFGVLLQFTVMPLGAWLLTQLLQLPADIALGVILVGACPGGTASNVITYIADGDVTLSVGMTIAATLLAPVVTPFWVYTLGGAWVDVSFAALMLSVVKIVLLPVLAGILVHRFGGTRVRTLQEVFPAISAAAIVFIIAGIIAVNRDKLLEAGLLVLAVVVLHNLLGMGLGLLAANLLRTNSRQATAIAVEVGMQNSGLAVALATANFAANPLATLPGAVYSVWHNISGSLFAAWRNPGTNSDSPPATVPETK
ncbi:MAG: bile acid:sodium symporter family protein [Veillonellaceae bacterium]|nr:bile acid:sodium symporter family protein [Veillonellaceae bacterium]